MISDTGLKLDRMLDAMAGSYAKTVRYDSSFKFLCPKCGGFKSPDFPTCSSCLSTKKSASDLKLDDYTANRIAAGIYAEEPTSQSLKMMYRYKDSRIDSVQYRRLIKGFMTLALTGHFKCLNEVSGVPVTAWAMVPSTKSSARYGKPHPLHQIISDVLPDVPEIPLISTKKKDRKFDPDSFILDRYSEPSLFNGNVLLIDDSWVTGQTIQSACARLKLEGAKQVSVYCVARLVRVAYLQKIAPNETGKFESLRYLGGYCPWHRCVERTH